jgi:regulator of replication initiation timing
MSLFDDIIKALPENTILRERARLLVEENESLKQEVASLKDDLREKNVKIAALQKAVDQSAHVDDLEEVELKLLHRIAHLDYDSAFVENLAQGFDLSQARIEYHVQRLESLGYAHGGIIDSYGTHYSATQEGRALLLKKNLL